MQTRQARARHDFIFLKKEMEKQSAVIRLTGLEGEEDCKTRQGYVQIWDLPWSLFECSICDLSLCALFLCLH